MSRFMTKTYQPQNPFTTRGNEAFCMAMWLGVSPQNGWAREQYCSHSHLERHAKYCPFKIIKIFKSVKLLHWTKQALGKWRPQHFLLSVNFPMRRILALHLWNPFIWNQSSTATEQCRWLSQGCSLVSSVSKLVGRVCFGSVSGRAENRKTKIKGKK